jgi:putative membrane protein
MWNFGWMWIGWILLVAVVTWAVVVALRNGNARRDATPDSPETILKRRFAKGEIDEQEFDRRLAKIHG